MKSIIAILSLVAVGAVAQDPPPPPPPAAAPIKINLGPPPAAGPMTQTVMVGGMAAGATPAPKMQFAPENIVAKPGDVVRFMFMDPESAVVQSTFEQPCQEMAGGFSAGPMSNAAASAAGGPTMDLTIESSEPLFMTSKAQGACGQGMVFSVNAPQTGAQQHSLFKLAAVKVAGPALGLKENALAQDQPAAQIASTVTVNVGNAAAAAATPGVGGVSGGQPSVVPGQGTTGSGQACGCQCLCGSGSMPQNAGVGSFGGFLGVMPGGSMGSQLNVGAMSPAGAPPMVAAAPVVPMAAAVPMAPPMAVSPPAA